MENSEKKSELSDDSVFKKPANRPRLNNKTKLLSRKRRKNIIYGNFSNKRKRRTSAINRVYKKEEIKLTNNMLNLGNSVVETLQEMVKNDKANLSIYENDNNKTNNQKDIVAQKNNKDKKSSKKFESTEDIIDSLLRKSKEIFLGSKKLLNDYKIILSKNFDHNQETKSIVHKKKYK